jgi:sialic acid synthase SpsE
MRDTFVIAEMACSHDGSVELAKNIIDGAASAGADAVQFQIWRHGNIVVPSHPDIDLLRKIELSREEWQVLADYVRQASNRMEIIACVSDREAAELAVKIGADAFKIHTADLSNEKFIRYVSRLGRRVDLSVGASTYSEIADAVEWIRDSGDADIWLMYGKQLFPTAPEDSEINQAVTLGRAFELPIGYQDHSDADTMEAFWLPIAARGAGLWIQEKHITHDRSLKGADHQAALNPDEFKRFVEAVRTVDAALGDGRPHSFSDAEKKYRVYSKKSIVLKQDCAAGHVITNDDVVFLRAKELGVPPDEIDYISGRSLSKGMSAFSVLKYESLS